MLQWIISLVFYLILIKDMKQSFLSQFLLPFLKGNLYIVVIFLLVIVSIILLAIIVVKTRKK